MFFKQFPTRDASLSYFFGCAGHGKAVAVDVVAGDEDWFIQEAEKASVTITQVIDTHLHADHYSGGRALAQRLNAPYCLHEAARDAVRFDFTPLRDGQMLDVGNVKITVVHTPGHTPESICLMVADYRRGAQPWFLVTGDTLFVGAVGRPDLLGNETEMAGQLFDSLHGRLLCLPELLEIFPGHQAGSACGAGLSGKPSSTIGFEKQSNAMLSLPRGEFITQLLRDLPARSPEMEAIAAVNAGQRHAT